MISVQVYLPKYLRDALDCIAARERKSRTQIIREMLTSEIKKKR
ncbi:MAG: ribbon-helix-helix protein, CopG family [Candidatus Levybacteria bacterium]|nr:ribbon-helix-helix protein, CopG family [Candidatus Levybacteria bacterium]